MGIRHHLAVVTIQSAETDMVTLSRVLSAAVSECKLYHVSPERDAAVLLIASQIALITGTDTPVRLNYNEQLQLCVDEATNDTTSFRTPTNVN